MSAPFLILLVALALLVASPAPAASGAQSATNARCRSAMPWQRARQAVGMVATIKGRVVGATYARTSEGRPTFLYLGHKPPHPRRFTVVIPGRHRKEFGEPELEYRGRTICVIGHVTMSGGVPRIEVTTPSQIRIAN